MCNVIFVLQARKWFHSPLYSIPFSLILLIIDLIQHTNLHSIWAKICSHRFGVDVNITQYMFTAACVLFTQSAFFSIANILWQQMHCHKHWRRNIPEKHVLHTELRSRAKYSCPQSNDGHMASIEANCQSLWPNCRVMISPNQNWMIKKETVCDLKRKKILEHRKLKIYSVRMFAMVTFDPLYWIERCFVRTWISIQFVPIFFLRKKKKSNLFASPTLNVLYFICLIRTIDPNKLIGLVDQTVYLLFCM